jgi:hypothetical protein
VCDLSCVLDIHPAEKFCFLLSPESRVKGKESMQKMYMGSGPQESEQGGKQRRENQHKIEAL